jgi:membrane dipeptidase
MISGIFPMTTSQRSRRDFLTRAAHLAALALLPTRAYAQNPDPELTQLLDSIIGVDMHSHAGAVHASQNVVGVDIAASMKQGRMTAICLGHTGDAPVIRREGNRIFTFRSPAPGELWYHTESKLHFLDGVVKSQGLRRALKRGDIEQAHKDKAPAIVQMIEGAQFLEGKLERVAEVHRRGVRQLQLVHFMYRDPVGDIQTENPDQGGLTGFGRELIAECNRLGMVIDTAHATMKFVEQAAKASKTPLIFSHTHMNPAPGPLSRTMSTEHARLIAQTGGVVGIWTIMGEGTLASYADRIARAVDAAGVDHVGLGSDVGGPARNVWPDYAIFPDIVQALRRKGFKPVDIGKIAGGNYVRVFNASCVT